MAFKSKHGAPMAWLEEHTAHSGDECLMWPFAIGATGYGNIRVGKTYANAHREMTRLVHGEPPFSNANAAHSCGVRGCVNPRHLRWATVRQNHADKIKHGTLIRGEQQHLAILSNEQVRSIYNDNRPQREIAIEHGCSRENVSRIKCGRNWAWLTQAPSAGE